MYIEIILQMQVHHRQIFCHCLIFQIKMMKRGITLKIVLLEVVLLVPPAAVLVAVLVVPVAVHLPEITFLKV